MASRRLRALTTRRFRRVTPRLGTDSSFEQLDVAVGHPSATLKVMRREMLNRCAGRDLSLVAGNGQTNLEEALFVGWRLSA